MYYCSETILRWQYHLHMFTQNTWHMFSSVQLCSCMILPQSLKQVTSGRIRGPHSVIESVGCRFECGRGTMHVTIYLV